MTAKAYLKTEKRMCNFYTGCTGCPFINKRQTCREFRGECPDEAIAIVKKWGDEHPVKTLLDKFFEVFPGAMKRDNHLPSLCPVSVGYKKGKCNGTNESCIECWSQPYIEPKE